MILNEKNFLLIAAKNYDMKRSISVDEFYDDMRRFQYIKRLFKRYSDTGELKTRLILNHLIVLYNCLGPQATHMLFMRLKEYHEQLKPFVVFLNYMPDLIKYEDIEVVSSEISLDQRIVEELRKI